MPIPKRYYEELQAKRTAENRQAGQDTRHALLLTGLWCVVWCVAGLVVFAFAFHTGDHLLGQVFWWGAHVVTYSGITVTLMRAYRRGEKRGDW